MKLLHDRRRTRGPEIGPGLICRLCWILTPFDVGRVTVTDDRIVYRCAHCEHSFAMRSSDLEALTDRHPTG